MGTPTEIETDTYCFFTWDGQSIEITVPKGAPISARRQYDRANHRPFAVDQARGQRAAFQLLGYCYGGRAHELVAEAVNCSACLADAT